MGLLAGMAHFDSSVERLRFPLRRDRRGLRAVFKLGNESGACPFACTFCGVGNSPRVDPTENRARFDRIYADYAACINGPYHALIFNEGNVTHAREFSRETLRHVLAAFAEDAKVQYVSLNSRESTATTEVLAGLRDLELPFPLHFIFGLETLSARGRELLGKENHGELDWFLAKLTAFNQEAGSVSERKPYLFGLDINLVFLPEIYLEPDQERRGNERSILRAFLAEFQLLLEQLPATVPCQINIHPYYEVPDLPFRSADLLQIVRLLPELHNLLKRYNETRDNSRVDAFVGVVILEPDEGAGSGTGRLRHVVEHAIEAFNATGQPPSAPFDM